VTLSTTTESEHGTMGELSSTTTGRFARRTIPAAYVLDTLRRHMLVDGYPLVIDLEKSHGCRISDALSGRYYLDFFSFFASNPLGFNHRRMRDEDVQRRLLRAATTRIANSDMYSSYLAEFVDTLERTAAPSELPYYFFVDGGSLAVENAMKTAFDWKVRKNRSAGRPDGGSQILHFTTAFHGRVSPIPTQPRPTFFRSSPGLVFQPPPRVSRSRGATWRVPSS
jgi:L-lysine 6-transaminase